MQPRHSTRTMQSASAISADLCCLCVNSSLPQSPRHRQLAEHFAPTCRIFCQLGIYGGELMHRVISRPAAIQAVFAGLALALVLSVAVPRASAEEWTKSYQI